MQNGYLQNLNENQLLPVKDTEGAVLVIAGAGSGKTRVLTNRIAYLVNELNVNPKDILAITFTNKAADEMKLRLSNMIDNVGDMWVSTIHSMCVRILRSSITAIGYDKNFSIYSEDDKDRVLKRIIGELDLEVDKYLKLAKNSISSAKNDDLSPREYHDEHIDNPNIDIITKIFIRYEQELKKSNSLDFDDLLIKTLHLLEENDDVREYYARKFRYVHVDEFQDTNTVQYKIIRILSYYYGNIFVVGDDDQSIYGWRGAKISNILDFEYDFQGARTYKLEQNYRSTKSILNCANLIISNNVSRKNKSLWTENETGEKVELYVANEEGYEAGFVATKIKSQIASGEHKASDYAVLMRVNALSRSFEQEFLKYNIPYKVYGGFKFFDRKEIKDLTAYLRIITNPLDNEAVLRIINVPRRGIGEKTISVIKDSAEQNDTSVFDEIMACETLPLNGSAITKISEFKKLLRGIIIDSEGKSVADIVKNVIEKTDFLSQFKDETEENHDKRLNVDELVNSAMEFDKENEQTEKPLSGSFLSDYLSSITLSSDTDEMNEGNFVTIATIHAVKGLEFDTVFLSGLDETIFPISRAVSSPEELEEERRLMYVAITRAEHKLYITRARSRYLYGSRSTTAESRFIQEIKPLLKYEEEPSYYSQNSYGYNNRNNNFNARNNGFSGRNNDNDFGYFPDEPTVKSSGTSFSSSLNNLVSKPKVSVSVSSNGTYKLGMQVSHKKFGRGTIVNVKENGKFIDVAFPGFGVKTLVSAVAPIEIIK